VAVARYLFAVELYAACPAPGPAPPLLPSTCSGSIAAGLRGCLLQKVGGCHTLLVLP
jgi:hypothetical protein